MILTLKWYRSTQNITADNSPDSGLEFFKPSSRCKKESGDKCLYYSNKEASIYTVERRRMIWSQVKDKPSEDILKQIMPNQKLH